MVSQLIFPLVITGFFAYSLVSGDLGSRTAALLPGAARYWLYLAPLALLAWVVVGSLSIYSFGWEGRSFALLRIGPLGPEKVLLAKGMTSFLPLMALFGILAVAAGIWQGAGVIEIGPALLVLAWTLGGVMAITISIGAIAARFDAEHPQKSVGPPATLAAMIADAAFIGATGLVVLRVLGVPLPFLPDWSAAVVGLPLVGVLIGIGALVRVAAHRIEEWQLD